MRAAVQDSVNPKFIPRQHLLHYAIKGAEAGDSTELNKLMDVLRRCGGRRGRHGKERGRAGEGRRGGGGQLARGPTQLNKLMDVLRTCGAKLREV